MLQKRISDFINPQLIYKLSAQCNFTKYFGINTNKSNQSHHVPADFEVITHAKMSNLMIYFKFLYFSVFPNLSSLHKTHSE